MEFTNRGEVYTGPFDVILAPNTVVQPDVLVVLNEHLEIITDDYILGAPDLVVEVASPGTVRRDRLWKKRAYARAGVSEYWMVDPMKQRVEVLVLEDGNYQNRGIFQGEQTLPSTVLPGFSVPVKQFFV